MKKGFSVQGLVAGIIALGYLLFAFIKNPSVPIRLMLIPFILCALCFIIKNICLTLHKPKFARYFQIGFKISFFSFVFGFLIYWCYRNIKTGQYGMVLFSVPFWMIAIYFVRGAFLKKKTDASDRKQVGKWNVPVVISAILVLAVIIAGIVLLFMGIKDTVKNARVRTDYASAEGTLVDYGIYNQSRTGEKTSTTYYLVYEYTVSGETYTVKTDYGTGSVPPLNSTREIKYDPQNPSRAIVGGTNSSHFLLLIGGFFTFGGLVFVLAALQIKGVFDKLKFDVLGTYIGFVFVAVAFGIIFFRYGEAGSFRTGLTSMGIFMIVPILFILGGSALMIKSIRPKKEENSLRSGNRQ